MGYTNIKKVTNQQSANAQGGVAFANQQPGHAWESWACVPGFSEDLGNGKKLPVPRTSDFKHGLWIYTTKGLCKVIDNDWMIKGKWDNGTTVTLIEKGEGADGDIEATINASGDITMRKA